MDKEKAGKKDRTLKAQLDPKHPTWTLYDNDMKREVRAKEYYAKDLLKKGSRYKLIRKS